MTSPVAHVIPFPVAPSAYSQSHLQMLQSRIQQELQGKVSKFEAVDTIIMRSPNGQFWDISVSDAGALVVTAHDGTKRL